jgi:hypothetical protein
MAVESSPYDNVSVLADNEATFHGVAPLGPPGAAMPEGLGRDSRLVRSGSGWHVHDAAGNRQARFSDDEVRITVSWKADVFANADEAELHDRGDVALTLETVVQTFEQDLASRGIDVHATTDPLADQAWIGVLASTYQDPAPRS